MRRAPFWIIAAFIALIAAALTLWLSPAPPAADSEQPRTQRTKRGWRTARLAPARTDAPIEQVEHPRIAALAPGIAQILRDLGCGQLIVGRHSSDDWTDQTVTVCSDQQSIDYERLIAARPTHVFLQWGERTLPERLTSLADEHGWVLVSYPMKTLDDIAHATVAIHGSVAPDELEALRLKDRARATRAERNSPHTVQYELENAHAALCQRFAYAFTYDTTLASVGRVLLLYQGAGEGAEASTRPAALGPGSYTHDLLLHIGGRTATPTGEAFIPLDAEDIATMQPDAIIIVRPRKAGSPAPDTPPSADDLLRTLGAAARLDIPAVNTNRIALIDDTMALVPGTNLTDFADRLRAILKGWTAGSPDVAPVRRTGPG